MSETTIPTQAPVSAEVLAERERVAREILTWAQSNGYTTYAASALRAVGLGEHLPRTSAEVQVTVVGTVTVRLDAVGEWTQADALYALSEAARTGRASVEVHEVPATGAPATE